MKQISQSIFIALLLTGIIVAIFLIQKTLQFNHSKLGLLARDPSGVAGILTCPLVHGNWGHLINNMGTFLPVTILMLILHRRLGIWILALCWVGTGLAMFLFARGETYHIGASGVIYAECAFLIASGFILPARSLKLISVLMLIFYGSMVWGVLPLEKGVSWDGHLCGAGTGVLLAWLFRKFMGKESKEPDLPEWSNHSEDDEDEYAKFNP